MSRRATELLYLILAGAVSTMAYVSVYAGRFREINRASIVYGLVFVAIFLVLHVVVRIFLSQADPYLLPVTALLAAIGPVGPTSMRRGACGSVRPLVGGPAEPMGSPGLAGAGPM